MTDRARILERAWNREGAVGLSLRALLLAPSFGYGAAVRARRLAYRLGLRSGARLPVPVISVGNLTVGGTGKTPTALWIAEELRARGWRVAILSRGYGGSAEEPVVVSRGEAGFATGHADWEVVGDEAALLAHRFDGPIVVARRRVEAGRIAIEDLGADVCILDDGFQHLGLHRDFDLVLLRAGSLDGAALLPAGRFREPASTLARADAVIVTKGAPGDGHAVAARFPGTPVYEGQLVASCLVTLRDGEWRELPIGTLSESRVIALTGIADPEPFYRMFQDWETRVEDCLEFPDHHPYSHEDWKEISKRARLCDLVVTTEKDLVKLARFPFAREKLVAVRVRMEVPNGEALVASILERISSLPESRGTAGPTSEEMRPES